MGVVSFSPDMNTVTQVRHDKRVIQWEQGDCREYLSCFNNNTNTFSDFTTDVFKMRWPFEGDIYDNSQKLSFFNFIDLAVIDYDIFHRPWPAFWGKKHKIGFIYIQR